MAKPLTLAPYKTIWVCLFKPWRLTLHHIEIFKHKGSYHGKQKFVPLYTNFGNATSYQKKLCIWYSNTSTNSLWSKFIWVSKITPYLGKKTLSIKIIIIIIIIITNKCPCTETRMGEFHKGKISSVCLSKINSLH